MRHEEPKRRIADGRLKGIACESVERGGGLGNSCGNSKGGSGPVGAGCVASIGSVAARADSGRDTCGGSGWAVIAKPVTAPERAGHSGTTKVVRVGTGPDVATRNADMTRSRRRIPFRGRGFEERRALKALASGKRRPPARPS